MTTPNPASCPSLVENPDGTLTDPRTGLMWKREPEGEFMWEFADEFDGMRRVVHFAGYSDWRLPSEQELKTLLEVDFPQDEWAMGNPDFLCYWTNNVDNWHDTASIVDFGPEWRSCWSSTYHRHMVRLVRVANALDITRAS